MGVAGEVVHWLTVWGKVEVTVLVSTQGLSHFVHWAKARAAAAVEDGSQVLLPLMSCGNGLAGLRCCVGLREGRSIFCVAVLITA